MPLITVTSAVGSSVSSWDIKSQRERKESRNSFKQLVTDNYSLPVLISHRRLSFQIHAVRSLSPETALAPSCHSRGTR